MIKANELRIGNFIQSLKKFYKVISVSEFESDTEIFTISSDGIAIPYPAIYHPISITEEWLLKLGYEKQHIRHFQGKYHSVHLFHEDCVVCDKTGVVIKSVHHLQNLYFSLTGEELTIKE